MSSIIAPEPFSLVAGEEAGRFASGCLSRPEHPAARRQANTNARMESLLAIMEGIVHADGSELKPLSPKGAGINPGMLLSPAGRRRRGLAPPCCSAVPARRDPRSSTIVRGATAGTGPKGDWLQAACFSPRRCLSPLLEHRGQAPRGLAPSGMLLAAQVPVPAVGTPGTGTNGPKIRRNWLKIHE